jgi:hypothetical protein
MTGWLRACLPACVLLHSACSPPHSLHAFSLLTCPALLLSVAQPCPGFRNPGLREQRCHPRCLWPVNGCQMSRSSSSWPLWLCAQQQLGTLLRHSSSTAAPAAAAPACSERALRSLQTAEWELCTGLVVWCLLCGFFLGLVVDGWVLLLV